MLLNSLRNSSRTVEKLKRGSVSLYVGPLNVNKTVTYFN